MKVDPIRIVEAVTAGVAFLAAGVVIFTRGQVHGLTTGAGMWLAGAIGVACGLGLWQIALFSTLLALVVLALLYAFESKMDLNQGEDFAEGEKDETSKRAAKARRQAQGGQACAVFRFSSNRENALSIWFATIPDAKPLRTFAGIALAAGSLPDFHQL